VIGPLSVTMSPSPRPAHEVSEGVYASIQPDWNWWISNTGSPAGRGGVDPGEYAGLPDAERISGNPRRAYAELDGAEPGLPRSDGPARGAITHSRV
jgi:hypothetical protein